MVAAFTTHTEIRSFLIMASKLCGFRADSAFRFLYFSCCVPLLRIPAALSRFLTSLRFSRRRSSSLVSVAVAKSSSEVGIMTGDSSLFFVLLVSFAASTISPSPTANHSTAERKPSITSGVIPLATSISYDTSCTVARKRSYSYSAKSSENTIIPSCSRAVAPSSVPDQPISSARSWYVAPAYVVTS